MNPSGRQPLSVSSTGTLSLDSRRVVLFGFWTPLLWLLVSPCAQTVQTVLCCSQTTHTMLP